MRRRPGFFLEFLRLEPGRLSGDGDYATLCRHRGRRRDRHRAVRCPADGTDRVRLRRRLVRARIQSDHGPAVALDERARGHPAARRAAAVDAAAARASSRPRRRTAHIVLRAGDRIVAERDVPREFDARHSRARRRDSRTRARPSLTLETDQWYVPAETQLASDPGPAPSRPADSSSARSGRLPSQTEQRAAERVVEEPAPTRPRGTGRRSATH